VWHDVADAKAWRVWDRNLKHQGFVEAAGAEASR
jgi:hypothetical protein